MAERVGQYPRWVGGNPLRAGPAVHIIVLQELRKAYLDFWFRLAAIFILAYSIVYLGNLYTLQQVNGDSVHTMANYITYLEDLRWGALAIGAVMAGPALLSDSNKGALELYLTRSVTMVEYLGAKVVAVVASTFLALLIPGLIYWVAAFFFFESQPAGWAVLPLQTMLYAFLWALLVAGLGLGLSGFSRSSRGATLILFGGFAILEIVIGDLLESITKEPGFQILSPFQAMSAQNAWIFGQSEDAAFPLWWGLAMVVGLIVLGWALLAWKHPRVRGDERGGR